MRIPFGIPMGMAMGITVGIVMGVPTGIPMGIFMNHQQITFCNGLCIESVAINYKLKFNSLAMDPQAIRFAASWADVPYLIAATGR